MKTPLLIVPGIALAIWIAGILFTTDLAVPVGDARRFKNVLAVFPHADDETVHCGGSIRRFSGAGATVTLLLLTGGERGNPKGASDPTLKAIRHREAERGAGILGVSRLIQEDFGDGQLRDRIEEVTAYLSRAITQINPDLIVTYDLAGLDGHQDHVACSETCCGDPGAGTWPSAPRPGGSRPSSEPIGLLRGVPEPARPGAWGRAAPGGRGAGEELPAAEMRSRSLCGLRSPGRLVA